MARYPRSYRPRLPAPTEGVAVQRHLAEELRAVQETLEGVLDMLPQSASEAPPRPRNGMIRRAESPWRPVVGQTTDRWVIYDDATPGWSYLD
jgi:hypothetical protein